MLLIVSSFVCKSSFRCLGASVSFCVGRYSHVLPGFCMSSTVCVCVWWCWCVHSLMLPAGEQKRRENFYMERGEIDPSKCRHVYL